MIKIINKESFNNMSILDQIYYINNLLETGETLNNICNNMPIAKKTLRNRFKKEGYIFNKNLRQYIQDIPEEASESQIKGQINIIDVLDNNSEHPKHPEGANKPEEQSLKDVYLRLEQMQKEINLIKQNNINNQTTAANKNNLSDKINTRLEQLRGGGESVSRVYRVNPEIQKEFKSLCKKHLGDGINISDIVSLCMLEFIEKYK